MCSMDGNWFEDMGRSAVGFADSVMKVFDALALLGMVACVVWIVVEAVRLHHELRQPLSWRVLRSDRWDDLFAHAGTAAARLDADSRDALAASRPDLLERVGAMRAHLELIDLRIRVPQPGDRLLLVREDLHALCLDEEALAAEVAEELEPPAGAFAPSPAVPLGGHQTV